MVKLKVGVFAEGVKIQGFKPGKLSYYYWEQVNGIDYRVISTCDEEISDERREIHEEFAVGQVCVDGLRKLVKDYEV